MQHISRYDVKPNRAGEYQQWLQKNEGAIRDNSVEGWEYVGTWFTVQGFGSYQAETRWEVADYAALGAGWGNDEFVRLYKEWFEFLDDRRPAETYLMKSAADVAILE